MAVEIERKFLVADDWVPPVGVSPVSMKQGYLTEPGAPVEIRLRGADERSLMTVKRSRAASGVNVRDEIEFGLPDGVFDELWPLAAQQHLTKLRYPVGIGDGLVADVDVYTGRHAGLRVVEVEFESEAGAAAFGPPPWFGPEITGDPRYSNRLLAGSPGLLT